MNKLYFSKHAKKKVSEASAKHAGKGKRIEPNEEKI